MSNEQRAAVAASLQNIAFHSHERACTDCKMGVPGVCRNSAACTRTMADARDLFTLAEYIEFT